VILALGIEPLQATAGDGGVDTGQDVGGVVDRLVEIVRRGATVGAGVFRAELVERGTGVGTARLAGWPGLGVLVPA